VNYVTYFGVNLGTGPVPEPLLRDAQENIKVFVHDLDMHRPRVHARRVPAWDENGRYGFQLRRGDRTCAVDMPGRPLDEVRDLNKQLYLPPRLYVAGSSWLWKFAVDATREELLDYDGAIQRENARAERLAKLRFKREPRCPTCKAIREIEEAKLRCFICEPDVHIYEPQFGGYAFQRVRLMRLPDLALRTDDDPICGKYVAPWPNESALSCYISCRRPRRHEGACEGMYKVELLPNQRTYR